MSVYFASAAGSPLVAIRHTSTRVRPPSRVDSISCRPLCFLNEVLLRLHQTHCNKRHRQRQRRQQQQFHLSNQGLPTRRPRAISTPTFTLALPRSGRSRSQPSWHFHRAPVPSHQPPGFPASKAHVVACGTTYATRQNMYMG